jgi:hypothetical protein
MISLDVVVAEEVVVVAGGLSVVRVDGTGIDRSTPDLPLQVASQPPDPLDDTVIVGGTPKHLPVADTWGLLLQLSVAAR